MRQTNRLRCDDLLDAALVVYEQSPDLTAITHAMVREGDTAVEQFVEPVRLAIQHFDHSAAISNAEVAHRQNPVRVEALAISTLPAAEL
jgi:hypothetical protein